MVVLVRLVLHDADDRFIRTRYEDILTSKEAGKTYSLDMSAGKKYVIDLESASLDACLRLKDDEGRLLAENNDASPGTTNARLLFTAPTDGVYRLIATSFQQRGTGSYTLRIREFLRKPASSR